MTHRDRCLAAFLTIAIGQGAGASAAPADGVAALHASWRGCLRRSFAVEAALTGRMLAADAALRACRAREDAYLAGLAASPLLDEDDVARVRPVLLQRARGWLIGAGPTPPL